MKKGNEFSLRYVVAKYNVFGVPTLWQKFRSKLEAEAYCRMAEEANTSFRFQVVDLEEDSLEDLLELAGGHRRKLDRARKESYNEA